MIRILIAEDSALMRKLLSGIFKAEGDFEIALARDGLEALDQVASFRPDVVTLDINMPKLDGLACLDRIMLEHPVPVVMVSALTADGADETLMALEMGAVDFIAKPDGAVSLHMAALTEDLVAKVRAAAAVQLPRARRLAERMRLRRAGNAPVAPTAVKFAPMTGISGLVVVGTSTGGPPALDILLSTLPADLRWPIVIAQHMPQAFTGPLARRLDRLSPLTVSEVVGPTPLLAGCVYVARGGTDVVISKRAGKLIANAAPMHDGYLWHPSVDRLVRTAMQQLPAPQLLGILLTGMGSDGAAAMAELRAAGGHTIAEAKDTAVVWGMPGELVNRGGAVDTLPMDDIPRRLTELLA
ncbi:two-component system, chemotaxis family, response regulator CheB [Kaistia soli DSM 19436]|uniref:Protein-glutamate methylesterase/protein-glutamine glutaminase n=1 Tax=Kaistia soli DSM 19436 TaxID=1122133 RepID=A0A1M5L0V1_9HYPH|nr:chemotaxis-specific protein-glutamate methyltransferase CheB [Kaistia soli]SHG58732.1 two-component system, chemotaxis family, response regulator CheB [Kaistia soli DSM 19436]